MTNKGQDESMKIKDTERDGEWFVKQAEKERLKRLKQQRLKEDESMKIKDTGRDGEWFVKQQRLKEHLYRTRTSRPSNIGWRLSDSGKWNFDP